MKISKKYFLKVSVIILSFFILFVQNQETDQDPCLCTSPKVIYREWFAGKLCYDSTGKEIQIDGVFLTHEECKNKGGMHTRDFHCGDAEDALKQAKQCQQYSKYYQHCCEQIFFTETTGDDQSDGNGKITDIDCGNYYQQTSGSVGCDAVKKEIIVDDDENLKFPTLKLGNPDHPALIFLHGWPDSAWVFINQLEYFCLPPNGKFYCIAPTYPGSIPNTNHDPATVLNLKYIIDGLEQVYNQQSLKDPTWVFHDWGAYFGYWFTYLKSNIVKRAVYLDIGNSLIYEYVPTDIKYQIKNRGAYFNKNSAMSMEIAENYFDAPCKECATWQSTWPYEYILESKHNFLKDIQYGQDWKFQITPDMPQDISFAFFYGSKDHTGKHERTVASKFHGENFEEYVKKQKMGYVEAIEHDHWFFTRPGTSDIFNKRLEWWINEQQKGCRCLEDSDLSKDCTKNMTQKDIGSCLQLAGDQCHWGNQIFQTCQMEEAQYEKQQNEDKLSQSKETQTKYNNNFTTQKLSNQTLSFSSFDQSKRNLHDTQQVHIYWKILEQSNQTHPGKLLVGMQVDSQGWIGVAFNDDPGMFGADFIVGKKNGDNFEIEDMHMNRYGKPYSSPKKDSIQNVKLIAAYQDKDKTQMIVERPIRICDSESEDISIENDAFVLYAWGSTNNFGYHSSQRGSEKIYLMQKKIGSGARI